MFNKSVKTNTIFYFAMLGLGTKITVCIVRLIKLIYLLKYLNNMNCSHCFNTNSIWKDPLISYSWINFGLFLIPAEEITKKPRSNEILYFSPESTSLLETLRQNFFFLVNKLQKKILLKHQLVHFRNMYASQNNTFSSAESLRIIDIILV